MEDGMNDEWHAMTRIRPLLVGFPPQTRRSIVADLRQWSMDSSRADSTETAVARLSEAHELGRPYRVALVYTGDETTDIDDVADKLRASGRESLALILCVPRDVFGIRNSRRPGQFSAIVALPAEKSLLYNALHGVLAGGGLAPGVTALSDHQAHRKGLRKSYHILVAEDDPTNRMIIGKQLERAGHTVKLVEHGEQALDALADSRVNYDVVILDWSMPVLGGLQAARMIRVMGAGRANLPIIMISAERTRKAVREASRAGVAKFFQKPIEPSALFTTIDALCEKRRGMAADILRLDVKSS